MFHTVNIWVQRVSGAKLRPFYQCLNIQRQSCGPLLYFSIHRHTIPIIVHTHSLLLQAQMKQQTVAPETRWVLYTTPKEGVECSPRNVLTHI